MNPHNIGKAGVSRVLVVVVIVFIVVIVGVAAGLSFKPSSSVSSTSLSSSKVTSKGTTSSTSLSKSSSVSTSTAVSSTSLITSYLTGTVLTETSLPYTLMPVANYNLSVGIVVDFYLNNAATLTGCFTASGPINYVLQQSTPDPGTVIVAQGFSQTQHCFNNALTSGFFYSIVVSANASAFLTVTTTVMVSSSQ